MADGNDGGSSAGDAASGGANGAGVVDSDTGTTDYKARCADLEQKLAKATGKAGSTQADLTTQLHAATNLSTAEKARGDKLERQLLERDALSEVLEQSPAHTRKAIRLVASSLLEKHSEIKPDADGTFATVAKSIVDKITADAPELFAAKPNVSTSPHVKTSTQPASGLLEVDGVRIF